MREPPRLRRYPRLLEGALKPRPKGMPLQVERWVWLSRFLQFVENLMPSLWPALGVTALFVTLAFLDAFRFVPPGLQGVVVTAFMAVITALAFFGLKDLRFPDRHAGLRRLEHDSGLDHRPLSSFEDRPATSLNDPVSRGLWAAHRARQARAWARLALFRRDDGLVRSDPFALRAAAVLAVVISGMAAGPDWDERLADALSPRTAAQIEGLRTDLWVTPPDYTGAPPLFLTGEKAAPVRDAVTVPAGSVLTARAAGVSREIRLRADPRGDGRRQTGKTVKLDDGGQESRLTLDRDATVSFRVAGRTVGRWKFAVTPDQPPMIALARPPRTTPVGALDLAFRAKDDYGVVSAKLRLTLVPRPEELAALEAAAAARKAEADANQGTQDAAQASPVLKPDFFLDPAKPVALPLSLPEERAREVEHKLVEPLADHPWAGREVLVQLVATDDPGQKGFSKGVKLTMPERRFTQPLAQALVEQRKALAADPYAYPHVAKVLGALLVAPEKFYEDKVVFLGLKSAHLRLTAQKVRAKELQGVFDLLWDLAVRIEDGDLSLALERLRQAQEALKQALRDGASEAELRLLMEELRQAVSAYIQALIESGRTMAELPEGMAESLSGEDLAGLLDKLQQLTETGAREAAQNLLSDLAALLENLQIAKGSGGGLTQGEQAMSRALDDLGEIIGDERKVLDDTFRGAQGAEEGSPGAGIANEFDRFSEAPLFMPNDVQGPFSLMPRSAPGTPGENRGAERFRSTPGGGVGNALPGVPEFPEVPEAPLMPGLPRVPDSLSRPPGGAAPAPKVRRGSELAHDQNAVRRKLDGVMEDLRKEGVDMPGSLDEAGRAMNRARESLAENDYDRALPDEREAIDKLREGAQSLARALTERLAGRQALGIGMPGGRDPLGRQPGANGFTTDGSVKVPDESALQEARRILEELRRRAAERGRPGEELEYLDRLLKRF